MPVDFCCPLSTTDLAASCRHSKCPQWIEVAFQSLLKISKISFCKFLANSNCIQNKLATL